MEADRPLIVMNPHPQEGVTITAQYLPDLPYVTEREMYGRPIRYSVTLALCDLCKQEKKCLSVDTSMDEYCEAQVCADCCAAAIRAQP